MKIRETFHKKRILKSRVLYTVFGASFLFMLGGVLWAYSALKDASGVIIHFNNVTGINLIGNFWSVISFGATGLIMVVINFFVALELDERDRFLGKLLAAETALLVSLIFIALSVIISVN